MLKCNAMLSNPVQSSPVLSDPFNNQKRRWCECYKRIYISSYLHLYLYLTIPTTCCVMMVNK